MTIYDLIYLLQSYPPTAEVNIVIESKRRCYPIKFVKPCIDMDTNKIKADIYTEEN